MRLLVIGGGGREHCLVWKLAESPRVEKIYAAPGNAGIGELAECISIAPLDIKALLEFCDKKRIDLTVVGPEAPLVSGVVDEFQKRGLRILGPKKNGAELEGSKVFCKKLLWKYGVPTGDGEVFDDSGKAKSYIEGCEFPRVVKADGLAAGKGVIICNRKEEAAAAVCRIMEDRIFGVSGERIIIEEFLQGEEVSYLVFSDGENVLPLISSQDHKAIYDGDKGPNTGGMGAYAPAPAADKDVERRIMHEIINPVIRGMAREGATYSGVLYAGLIITDEGPKVLEFNVRFGDPETQAILPLLETDLLSPINACIEGSLGEVELEWREGASVCVVVAAGGYPGKYQKGQKISGLERISHEEGIHVFHGGTSLEDGEFLTNGGRVLGVTGVAESIQKAIDRTYSALRKVDFEGAYYRKDIGYRALKSMRTAGSEKG